MCLLPVGAWSWGVSAPRGVPGPGSRLRRGVPGGDPPQTATAAGSTHPTGMHSCSIIFHKEMKKKHYVQIFKLIFTCM